MPKILAKNALLSLLNARVKGCGKIENIRSTVFRIDSNRFLFLTLCLEHTTTSTIPGYSGGVGSITLQRTELVKDTIVSLIQEWRGPKFSEEDRSAWPASKEEIDLMIDRFNKAVIVPFHQPH